MDTSWITWDPSAKWWHKKDTRIGETRCFDCVVIGHDNTVYTFIVVVGGICKLKYRMSVSSDARLFATMWANKYGGELSHFAETNVSKWFEPKILQYWHKLSKLAIIHRHKLKNGKIGYPPHTGSVTGAINIRITDLLELSQGAVLIKQDSCPDAFICPITMKIMEDPVICPEGQSFEREAIEIWLSKNETNPLTRTHLTRDMLIPNISLRNAIQQLG